MVYTGECTLGMDVLDIGEMPKDAQCKREGE